MAKVLQILKLKETINVGAYKVEVNNRLKAEAIKFDNGEIKVRYTNEESKATYTTPPVPKEYTKIVWQKAQQQQ